MINEEIIKILKKISDECDCRSAKAFKNHVPSCEECPYYLPNMPDEEECLFDHRPCVWDDYLKIIVDRMKQEGKDEIYCTECPYFTETIYAGEEWYGAYCKKDGHGTEPSMYAIKSLHNNCPLTAEREKKR